MTQTLSIFRKYIQAGSSSRIVFDDRIAAETEAKLRSLVKAANTPDLFSDACTYVLDSMSMHPVVSLFVRSAAYATAAEQSKVHERQVAEARAAAAAANPRSSDSDGGAEEARARREVLTRTMSEDSTIDETVRSEAPPMVRRAPSAPEMSITQGSHVRSRSQVNLPSQRSRGSSNLGTSFESSTSYLSNDTTSDDYGTDTRSRQNSVVQNTVTSPSGSTSVSAPAVPPSPTSSDTSSIDSSNGMHFGFGLQSRGFGVSGADRVRQRLLPRQLDMAIIHEADESAQTPSIGAGSVSEQGAVPSNGQLAGTGVGRGLGLQESTNRKPSSPSPLVVENGRASSTEAGAAGGDPDADEDENNGGMTRLQRAFTRMLCSAVARVHRVMQPPPNAIPPPPQLPRVMSVHTTLSSNAHAGGCACPACRPYSDHRGSVVDSASWDAPPQRGRLLSKEDGDVRPMPKPYRHDMARGVDSTADAEAGTFSSALVVCWHRCDAC
jgi:hypothetical protein